MNNDASYLNLHAVFLSFLDVVIWVYFSQYNSCVLFTTPQGIFKTALLDHLILEDDLRSHAFFRLREAS